MQSQIATSCEVRDFVSDFTPGLLFQLYAYEVIKSPSSLHCGGYGATLIDALDLFSRLLLRQLQYMTM